MGRQFKEVGVQNIIVGMIFSYIYLPVASYFYVQVTNVENSLEKNCTLVHTGNLDRELQHFCESVVSWKVCAILGTFGCGVTYIILGWVTVFLITRQNITLGRRQSYEKMWLTFGIIADIVSMAIFFVLLLSDAQNVKTGNADTLNTAALIYLIVVGTDSVWLLPISTVILPGCCCCSLLFCIWGYNRFNCKGKEGALAKLYSQSEAQVIDICGSDAEKIQEIRA